MFLAEETQAVPGCRWHKLVSSGSLSAAFTIGACGLYVNYGCQTDEETRDSAAEEEGLSMIVRLLGLLGWEFDEDSFLL